MFILNRLRGKWGWFAYVVGVLFGLLVWPATGNYYVAGACAVGYVVGESFGWGDWIGGLLDGVAKVGDEGEKNGIKWLALKLSAFNYPYEGRSLEENIRIYNIVALVIRGFYWWIPALIPLVFVEPIFDVLAAIVLLSMSWPVAIWLAIDYKWTVPLVSDKWCRQEVIYGIFMDFVLAGLLVRFFI